jgi:integrase
MRRIVNPLAHLPVVAALLPAEGVHQRVVMEQLGHSTITLTMNVYSHVIPATAREAAERMDALLSGTG